MDSPITNQPRGFNAEEPVADDSAEGLDLLSKLDQLIIVQKPELVDPAEHEAGHQGYIVMDGTGNKLFWAAEMDKENMCCGSAPQRPFQIALIDKHRKLVLRLSRPCDPCLLMTAAWQFCCCWFGRIGGSVSVGLRDGRVIGQVVHSFRPCYIPYYNVLDVGGRVVFRLRGEVCSDCCCCQSYTFRITNRMGTNVGRISRDWQEERISLHVSDADKYLMKMEEGLDVEQKALLMASVFLLDFMYFENTTRSHTKTQTKNIRPRVFPFLTKVSE